MNWRSFCDTCDELIRGGQIQAAATQLSRVNKSKIPRAFRLPLANLCRRARLNGTGLKILWPAVNPKRADQSPTAHELVEYAVLLQRNGAAAEALRILNATPAEKCAEVSLYQGFSYMTEWRYDEAARSFQAYLQAATDPYQRRIAKTNLASVLIGLEHLSEAEVLLREILAEADPKKPTRLSGNCFEMLAQISFSRGDLAETRARLEQAAEIFNGHSSWDLYLIRKWKAVLESVESGSSEGLRKMRVEAEQQGDSETVREVDLFLLKFQYDENLHSMLTVGTPFPFFRERVRRLTGLEQAPRRHILGDENAPTLDIRTGLLDGSPLLNPGKKAHQILDALTRDLYRPLKVGSLFARLFSGENYDINSSPTRVHQAVRHTRLFLEKHAIPIEIVSSDGLYSLKVGAGFAISLPLERETVEGMAAQWARMLEVSRHAERISRGDVMSTLGLSESSAQRLLRWAVGAGKVEVDRRIAAQRYKFKVAA